MIRTGEEAARHFADDHLAQVIKQVNFEKQFALLFAWRGSGQDRLVFQLTESEPAEVNWRSPRHDGCVTACGLRTVT